MKKIIDLYPLTQMALILSDATGIFYTHQVGGVSLLNVEAEGILVFMDDNNKGLYDKISYYTRDLVGLKKKDADYLDSIFMRKAKYLRVDRSKLKESMEAWIYVVFEHGLPKKKRNDLLLFGGFDCKSGILTWDNSD